MQSRLTKKLSNLRSARAIVAIAVLLVLTAVGLETARTLHNEYDNHVDEILASSERTAQKLAVRTTDVFDGVNQATRLVEFLQERENAPSLQTLRAAGVISPHIVQFVYTTDQRGFVVDTSETMGALNVADEPFFKRHRAVDSLETALGSVWVNPINQAWGIPVTRRLGGCAAFEGIIVALVDPGALSVSYAKSEERGTAVGVLGEDGVFRARSLDGKLTFGDKADPRKVIERAKTVRAERLPFTSPIDGVPRFLSALKVDRYPLVAVVAVDADAALVPYRRTRDLILVWAASASLVTLLAGWLSLDQANRLDASRRRSRRAEADFYATLEGSMDAVLLLQAIYGRSGELLDMTVRNCNALAAKLLLATPGKLKGCRLTELLPAFRPTGGLVKFEQVMRTQRPAQAEYQSTEAAFFGRWFHYQLVPLHDGIAFICREVTDRRAAEQSLAALARTDSLTGLANRREFEEFGVSARARAARSGSTLALFFIDLDGFKSVNDEHGHAAGDAVLVEVARRLKSAFRETDMVARLGGDEFAVVAEAAGTLQEVEEVGARAIAALEQMHSFDGKPLKAAASIGIALFDGTETVEALSQRADEAMYSAKSAGKSVYRVAALSERHAVSRSRPTP